MPGTATRALDALFLPPARVYAASPADSVSVTTTADVADGNTSSISSINAHPGPDGEISLREAMLAANATAPGPALTIGFSIPTADEGYNAGSATWKISLGAALPALTRRGVTIDGTTQAAGAHPAIVLDGFNVYEDIYEDNTGIIIKTSDTVVRGLTLMNFFYAGAMIQGPNATNNRILGCFIGTDELGTGAQPNGTGIDMRDGASYNTIGGTDAASRNLISGNNWDSGVLIQGPTTAHNTVVGNWIGTNATGLAALGNIHAPSGPDDTTIAVGIRITAGTHDNQIGGAGGGNVISGNDSGLWIDGSAANTIAGNIMGLGADGKAPLANINGGIFVVNAAHDNLIGGTTADALNIISGNGQSTTSFGQGIYISDPNTTRNSIQGNYIGVQADGIHPSGNYRQGVLIAFNANGNIVGGTAAGAGNVIAYNGLGGIRIDSAMNQVVGNLIGVGVDRTTPLGNQANGVRIFGDSNVIGPNNLIANSQLSGIMLSGRSSKILQNTIRSNARSGICVLGPDTTIMTNTIVYNGGVGGSWPDCNIEGGIVITDTSSTYVTGNTILDNQGAGITVRTGSLNSILLNSISGNTTVGIQLLAGGNGGIAPPLIQNISQSEVRGVGCPSCRIELFTDSSNQGRYYVGYTKAQPDGSFRMALPITVLQGSNMTATLTDPSGNTSPFAVGLPLPERPPPSHLIYLPLVAR